LAAANRITAGRRRKEARFVYSISANMYKKRNNNESINNRDIRYKARLMLEE